MDPKYRERIERELSAEELAALHSTMELLRVPADRWPAVHATRRYAVLSALLRRVRRLEAAGHSRRKAIAAAAAYFGIAETTAASLIDRALRAAVRGGRVQNARARTAA